MKLQPWRLSGILTATRTYGEIGLRLNGNMLDIWICIDGRPKWFAVGAQEVKDFLAQFYEDSWYAVKDKEIILPAISDGNAEH